MDIEKIIELIDDRRKELRKTYIVNYRIETLHRLNELTTIKKRIKNYQKASKSDTGQNQGWTPYSSANVIVVPEEVRKSLEDISKILGGKNE
jgi:hypothetical protein